MWWANRFLLAVGCCFFCQRKNIPWLNFVFRVLFWFFFAVVFYELHVQVKLKLLLERMIFRRGRGHTRRKYLALKKFSFTDPRVLLGFFLLFECTRFVAPYLAQ